MFGDDMFNAFFGGGAPGGGFATSARGQRGPGNDVDLRVEVSLEDMYNGTTVERAVKRTVACRSCRGRGTKSANVPGSSVCTGCRGSGERIMVRQMGMMAQQVRTICPACQGSGQLINPANRCAACGGQKTEEVSEAVSIVVQPGTHHDEVILCRGKGHEYPGTRRPGDLFVYLSQAKHAVFVRNGDDLHMKREITLAEALCGFQFALKHLDNRDLVVRRNRGEVTKPGEFLSVKGEGMPRPKSKNGFGDLVINFEITFPEQLTVAQLAALTGALPASSSPAFDPNTTTREVCYVQREPLETLRREIEKDEALDDDDDGSQQQAGCAAQ